MLTGIFIISYLSFLEEEEKQEEINGALGLLDKIHNESIY